MNQSKMYYLDNVEELRDILPNPSVSKISQLTGLEEKQIYNLIRKPIINEVYTRKFINYNELYNILKNYDIEIIKKLNKLNYDLDKKTLYNLKLLLEMNNELNILIYNQEVTKFVILHTIHNKKIIKISLKQKDVYMTINEMFKFFKENKIKFIEKEKENKNDC